jgi:hypothetical protein
MVSNGSRAIDGWGHNFAAAGAPSPGGDSIVQQTSPDISAQADPAPLSAPAPAANPFDQFDSPVADLPPLPPEPAPALRKDQARISPLAPQAPAPPRPEHVQPMDAPNPYLKYVEDANPFDQFDEQAAQAPTPEKPFDDLSPELPPPPPGWEIIDDPAVPAGSNTPGPSTPGPDPGVQQGDAKAVKWWRLAADQGDADAQVLLGLMYANGEGVAQDYAEAVKWWRLAADQGDANAQVLLGTMYANGEGVAQDYAEAVKWWRLAADQGDANAQVLLGTMYANGEGVAQDYILSHMWFNLAAAQGNVIAGLTRNAIADLMTSNQLAVSGGGRSDSPIAALVEGLRYAAIVQAELTAIANEVERCFGAMIAMISPIVHGIAWAWADQNHVGQLDGGRREGRWPVLAHEFAEMNVLIEARLLLQAVCAGRAGPPSSGSDARAHGGRSGVAGPG